MKTFSILAATIALLLTSFASQATTIKANYTVDLNTSDPGLKLHYADVAANPFSVNLDEGDSVSAPLFKIWTDETSVNNDDAVSKPISVDFSFLLPQIFNGSVTGSTIGGSICFFVCFSDYGEVTWDGPADIYFGANNDGHIRITLDNATFNQGFFGTSPGEHWGATVHGTMTLIADATAVPAPGGLAAFGLVLLGLGVFLRRKRQI